MKKNYTSRRTFKKQSVSFFCALFACLSLSIFANGQTLLDEDFSTQALPTGWTNVVNAGGDPAGIWLFDNPEDRNITGGVPGFDTSFAIFDSDHYGAGVAEDASLTTPAFDASGITGTILLSFDNSFQHFGNAIGEVDVWDGSTWNTVLTIQSDDGYPTANHKSIDITAAAGGANAAKIRFHYTATYDWWWAIDNVKVEVVSCVIPTGLAAEDITDDEATITWVGPLTAPANGYAYYYSTNNTAPTATTSPAGTATDTYKNLTGLTANTWYYFWVRSVCSGTQESDWSVVDSFLTHQIPATLPYNENFTSGGSDWTITNGSETNGWYVGNATGHPGKSVYVSDDGGTTNHYDNSAYSTVHVFREITFPTGNPFLLNFDWKGNGEDYSDYLNVWIVPDTFTTIPGQLISPASGGLLLAEYLSSSNGWDSATYVIPDSFAGTTSKLVFEWKNDNFTGAQPPAAVDNISIIQITCLTPDGLVASNITQTAADVSWNTPATLPANGFEYYYSTSNTPPVTGTAISGSTTDTVAHLTGLTDGTTYYFWARAICSSTDTSLWSSSLAFTTACNTATVPYVVPLATVNSPDLPNCTTGESINTTSYWETQNAPGSGFNGNTLVGHYSSFGSGPANAWFFTNGIQLTGGTTYTLHYRYGNNTPAYQEKLAVKYGTTAVSDSMTILLADHQNISSGSPQDTSIVFTPPTTDIYYLGFQLHSDENQFFLFVDSISVIAGASPTCNAPDTLDATNITNTSALLSWNGTASDYILEYDTSGFTLGTGTIVSVAGNSYTVNGLTPNTSYDFYVRAVCTPGTDTSSYSSVATFVTTCGGVTVDLGADTAICAGDSIVLDAGNPGSDYLWNDNATSQTLTVTDAGSYSVTVTTAAGCTGADTIEVSVNPLPSATAIQAEDNGNGSFTFTVDGATNADTYSWDFGDNSALETNDTANHTYTASGTYTVTLVISNECGSDTLTKDIEATVGIENIALSKEQLKIYPNPAHDHLTILNTSNLKMEQITVYNVLGQVVYSATPDDTHEYKMNVSRMTSGLYTIRIKTNAGFVTRKFEVRK